MRKLTIFPLLLLSLFVFTNSVTPDYVAIESRTPAATVDCIQVAQAFLNEQKPRLAIAKNSLFAKYPALIEEMDKLEFIPLNLNNFHSDFYKGNQRAPNLREALEYIYSLRKEMISNYDEVIADLQAMRDPALGPFINELIFSRNKLNKFKDIDHYQDELENAFSAGKTKLTSLDGPIAIKSNGIESRYLNYLKERSREGNFNGEWGELSAYAASKDKALNKGLKFETRQLNDPTPYQQIIADAVNNLEESLGKKTDKQLITLVNTYGEGILRNAKMYLNGLDGAPLDRSVLIAKIISMIRTKEIDLICEKNNGRIVWGEVKAYKKPITVDTLNGEGYKLKPMIEQLKEHKALRDILGFKTSVDLRFIAPTSEITPDARAMIEALGYEVIGAK